MELYNIAKGIIFETVQRDNILKSLENRKIVNFWYDDPDDPNEVMPGYREVEPYVYGKHYKSGNPVIRGWLIRGTSKTGEIDPSVKPGWRLFRVDRMNNWQERKESFEPYIDGKPAHEKYNPDDKHMQGEKGQIFYAIEPEGGIGDRPGTGTAGGAKDGWWTKLKRRMKNLFNEEYNNEGVIL
jgi:hypothetical protein